MFPIFGSFEKGIHWDSISVEGIYQSPIVVLNDFWQFIHKIANLQFIKDFRGFTFGWHVPEKLQKRSVFIEHLFVLSSLYFIINDRWHWNFNQVLFFSFVQNQVKKRKITGWKLRNLTLVNFLENFFVNIINYDLLIHISKPLSLLVFVLKLK